MVFIKKTSNEEMSFLDHLEELRWHIVRSLVAILAIAIFFFINKTILFDLVILGPKSLDFWTYRFLCSLSNNLNLEDALCFKEIPFLITNIEMSGQFILHIKISFLAGIVVAFPYVFYEVWRFIKPALHKHEQQYTRGVVFWASILFIGGVLFGYFFIVPFSINFLGSYQVSPQISNNITLDSYISTITSLVFAAGLIFELPMIVYFLAKIGLISPEFMKSYRKHALIINLIISAIITPPDVTSQMLIGIPLYILYEISIIIAAKVYREREISN